MIKSELKKIEKKGEKKYPYIGKSKSGDIVLFYAEMRGVVLVDSQAHDAGYHSTLWIESSFELFEGPITISNA